MSGVATRPFSASHIALSLSALFLLLAGCLLSQAVGQEATAAQNREPAAFVYVLSSPGSNKVEINAFRAASNGRLSIAPGSPFPTEMTYGASIAVNEKFLFATSGVDIYSYYITNEGTLQQTNSVNAQKFNLNNCGGPQALFLDRTGSFLYDLDYYSDCSNNAYQSFSSANSTGDLSYLGVTAASTPIFEVPLSFSGNNEYAYGASCYHWLQEIFGFKRSSDGNLTDLNITPAMPISKPDQMYCPNLAAADTTNHLAVPMQALNSFTLQPVGPGAIAIYTANSAGELTTASTYSNMPKVGVGTVTSVSTSPSGKLLAVGGASGLQVFHFNGAEPVTAFGGLLTTDAIDQISWDNHDHLYAISQSAGLLFVFRITPASRTRAPGSPYAIANPNRIAVLPK
jgi:hypothetical protein